MPFLMVHDDYLSVRVLSWLGTIESYENLVLLESDSEKRVDFCMNGNILGSGPER